MTRSPAFCRGRPPSALTGAGVGPARDARRPAAPAIVVAGLLAAALSGCSGPAATGSPLQSPPPYRLFDVDRNMSCAAVEASFHDAAVRAARLGYWLDAGTLPTYGLDRFGADAPARLEDERGRLDALSDLQRYKGCTVQDPVGAVALERSLLAARGPVRPPAPPVPLRRLD